MKLFKKKHKDKLEEPPADSMPADGMMNGMPAPPTVPSQDPRHSSRRLQPPPQQQDPRYSMQQQQHQHDPRGYSHQQQQDPRVYSQQQQQQDPRGYRQSVQDHPQASYRQSANHRPQQPRQGNYDARHMQQQEAKPEYEDAPPVRQQVRHQQQAKQEYDDVPPARQEYDAPPVRQEYEGSPRQSFEPTKEPSAKEKSAPVVFIDPVVQMERAAVTRELVKQYVADIWNRGDLDLIPEVCARGLRFNGSAGMDRVGHEGFARMVQTIRGSLEDYHCEIHSMVVEGNKAFCRMRFTGRHVGQLLGHEATGKHVSWMGASEFTVVDGLIVKVWELGDMASLEHQLRKASAGGGGRAGPAGADEGL